MNNGCSLPARRLAAALVAVSVLVSAGWLWWNAARRSAISFLPNRAPAQWIVYPSAPDSMLHLTAKMPAVFRRSFVLEAAPTRAVLEVAGFQQSSLAVNGP